MSNTENTENGEGRSSTQRLVRHLGPIKSMRSYRSQKQLLEQLSAAIKVFENEKWPTGKPPLTELIEARLAELKLESSDLADLIGSKGHLSEILAGNRTIPRLKLLEVADFLEIDVELILTKETQDA